ncbi:Putative ribonuclease H protein At1g65750 [Linum perenne]
MEFQDWLRRDWVIKIKHVYREANHAADYVANYGHNITGGTQMMDNSYRNLAYFIHYDCMEISEPKLVD